MNKRYWEADEIPDALMDWVSENVAGAIKYFWEDDPPFGYVNDVKGNIFICVLGPGKPTEEDQLGMWSNYTVNFDLLAKLKEYSEPYYHIGGPCSDAQIKDMRERAYALRKLANDVAALADRAEFIARIK